MGIYPCKSKAPAAEAAGAKISIPLLEEPLNTAEELLCLAMIRDVMTVGVDAAELNVLERNVGKANLPALGVSEHAIGAGVDDSVGAEVTISKMSAP